VVAQLAFTAAVWVQLATTLSLVALPLLVAELAADKINPATLTLTAAAEAQAVVVEIPQWARALVVLEQRVKDLLVVLVLVVLTGPLAVAVELVALVYPTKLQRLVELVVMVNQILSLDLADIEQVVVVVVVVIQQPAKMVALAA
jgi:hypothetical protein